MIHACPSNCWDSFFSSQSHWWTTLGNTATSCVNPTAMGGWCPGSQGLDIASKTSTRPWRSCMTRFLGQNIWMFAQMM